MQRRISPKKHWRVKRRNMLSAWRVRSALGRYLQRYVFEVLKSALENGAPIKEVKESRTFSPADRKGWDIVIFDNDNVRYPLQIKSSEAGAEEFRRRGAEMGLPPIAVIVPRLNDTPQEILDKVGEVMPFLRGFKLDERRKSR